MFKIYIVFPSSSFFGGWVEGGGVGGGGGGGGACVCACWVGGELLVCYVNLTEILLVFYR